MIKLLGALCILFAGTLLGFYQALQLSRRPSQIRQLIQALQRLETEVMYGFTPLPDAFRAISKPLSAPLAKLFQLAADQLIGNKGFTTQESLQYAVSECWKHTSMKQSERDVVEQLGYSLGITDREDQIKHLRLAISHLHAEEATACDEQKRFEKMWKSLGLLSAALVVLLMY